MSLFDLVIQEVLGGGMSEGLRTFLTNVRDRGWCHGYDLISLLPNTCSVADADDLLKGAMSAGWIQRGKMEPNTSQKFLGGGGLWYDQILRLEKKGEKPPYGGWDTYAPATWFVWFDCDSKPLRDWLKKAL